MVNHKAVYFNAEPLRMILGYNILLNNLTTLNVRRFGKVSARIFFLNLGEICYILLRSHRDSQTHKHHGEITARFLQSRWDLSNLEKVSPILARFSTSRWDLPKIHKLTNIMERSRQDLANLSKISLKILHGYCYIQYSKLKVQNSAGIFAFTCQFIPDLLQTNSAHLGTDSNNYFCWWIEILRISVAVP